ncbi:MAG: hypothetical protein ACRDU5_21220 [Mycobacterium sp.]
MSGRIRANPEDLKVCAIRVDGHAEEVQLGHAAADGRIEAAQAGLPAASAAAMTSKGARWQETTAVLHARLSGHGVAFHGSAEAYAMTEGHNADAVAEVGVAGVQTSGSIPA